MLQKHRHAILALTLVLVASPLHGQAQTPTWVEEDSTSDSFGLGNQDLFVPAYAFQSDSESPWVHTDLGYFTFRDPSSGIAIAPLTLPAGARIVVVTCYFFDNDLAVTATAGLFKYTYNTSTDVPDAESITPSIISSNAGYHRVFESYDETVRYRPSLFTRQHYALFFAMLSSSTQIRFRGCNVTWQRQVTPAPATATFSDVPVGHPFHQFVEALVDAGITAGCLPGLYCVNNPITRGEMAVFIAAALGLHFPN